MNETKKKTYIDLINKIKVDDEIKAPFLNFIQTYDGSNHADFKFLVLYIIALLTKFAELEIKAEGYDMLKEVHDNYEFEFAALKEEYEQFKKGKLPLPPHISDNGK